MNFPHSADEPDYGPLALLAGTWAGDTGLDRAPAPEGAEETPYDETLRFEAIGEVTNAGSQRLAALRYHQVVRRKADGEVFHNETGYWMWDAANGILMHSLTIPRGVCVLAGGRYRASSAQGGVVILEVSARLGDPDWGIVQSPFMRDRARTTAFEHRIEVRGEALEYRETTRLEIYGRRFEHSDGNRLIRQ